MAEMHIIGQLISAEGFSGNGVCCKWGMHFGSGWRLVEGLSSGQTQVDIPEIDEIAHFCHPIDVHLATRTLQGWPKINIQVYRHDSFGRQDIQGYGVVHVPTTPGEHDISCATWRPAGSFREEVTRQFVGGGIQVRHPESIHFSVDRYKLTTTSMGTVDIHLALIMRNFDKFGIEC